MGFLTVLGKETQQRFSFSQFHRERGVGLAPVGGIPTFCTGRRDALCWRDEFIELTDRLSDPITKTLFGHATAAACAIDKIPASEYI